MIYQTKAYIFLNLMIYMVCAAALEYRNNEILNDFFTFIF